MFKMIICPDNLLVLQWVGGVWGRVEAGTFRRDVVKILRQAQGTTTLCIDITGATVVTEEMKLSLEAAQVYTVWRGSVFQIFVTDDEVRNQLVCESGVELNLIDTLDMGGPVDGSV